MSFALTTKAVQQQTKRVTRRLGTWMLLKPGDLLQPVEKGQGLKKGQKVVLVGGPIRVVSVRQESLGSVVQYGPVEMLREGFPKLTPEGFIRMFCEANNCEPSDEVVRIEFEYLNGRES